MYIPDAKILLVDDDRVNLQVSQSIFFCFSVRPDTAESGKKALEMLEKQRYDIVFMDQKMPEMSGKETIECIRNKEAEYYRKLPVYMLSAQEEGLEEELAGTGIRGVLKKTLKKENLAEALRILPPDLIFESADAKREVPKEVQRNFLEEGTRILTVLKQEEVTENAGRFVEALSGLKEAAIQAGAGTLVKLIREYEFKSICGKNEEIMRNMKMVEKFLENYMNMSRKSIG